MPVEARQGRALSLEAARWASGRSGAPPPAGGVGWGRRRRGAPAATRANRALPKGVAAALPSRAPGTSKRPALRAALWDPEALHRHRVAMTPARGPALSLALLLVALAADLAAGMWVSLSQATGGGIGDGLQVIRSDRRYSGLGGRPGSLVGKPQWAESE